MRTVVAEHVVHLRTVERKHALTPGVNFQGMLGYTCTHPPCLHALGVCAAQARRSWSLVTAASCMHSSLNYFHIPKPGEEMRASEIAKTYAWHYKALQS